MKKIGLIVLLAGFLILPFNAMAKMGSGQVKAKSSDIDIEMFGSLKTYPHFMTDIDFNSDDTGLDRMLDENGWMKDHSIRNEIRLGWQATAEKWDFLIVLEGDATLNKANADRGTDNTQPGDSGMTGEDFGVEKLNFGYNFGPLRLDTGWNTKALDIQSGGILYGDDHPYIGLSGKIGTLQWETLYLIVQDEVDSKNGLFDGDSSDWRAYTLRLAWKLGEHTLAPIYAFSDNSDHDADVHYLGFEGYGKIGMLTPRLEFIYATGDQDDNDIDAWGTYFSVEAAMHPLFQPYVGAYYLTGDEAADDDEVNAFNGITNISRYSPTFGMENAFIYRYIPALGSHLYSNNFNTLGKSDGYGGISNSSRAEAPGMIMAGLGTKGCYQKWSYKTQLMYFWFEDTGSLEDLADYPGSIDDNVGLEFDLQLTYQFNKHFSLGNVLSLFDPGDGIQDLYGDDYDDMALMDTVELQWTF
jgi:hypothetical protein